MASSLVSLAEIFLFGKTKLSKTLMPALSPRTVIMIKNQTVQPEAGILECSGVD